MTSRNGVVGGELMKLPTGIPGFDHIAKGGLPTGRTTLVVGTSGSAKTVFATQFLVAGITNEDEPGVFVTFEERPEDIQRNMSGFGWNIAAWEAEGRFTFVDASADPGENAIEVGRYDLGGLLARIEHAVQRSNAKRVSLDSIGAIYGRFCDASTVRRELFRIGAALKTMGVTAVLTAEREDDHGPISRHGVEEFVADNVIVLRNVLEAEKRRRTIEVLKFRGTPHQTGEWPFTLQPDGGIFVIPLSAIELTRQISTGDRVSSGVPELDSMCGGGFYRSSIILVSGATGTGKTLTTTHFIKGGVGSGARCLLFAFEESREQLFRNAHGWGLDFDKLEERGLLRVVCVYPESASLEDHLISVRREIDDFAPDRFVVDSLSALERVGTPRGFREFVVGLTSYVRNREITGIFTATTPSLIGGGSVTEAHISTITDSIILLRYVEMFGEMQRGITVLKMRGSAHDKNIRAFDIDGHGMHIGEPFRNVTGIISGNLQHVGDDDLDRLSKLRDAVE